MTRPFNPYSVYTAKFLHLLDSCRNKRNPAMWLFENDARSTLFMLESISRIWYRAFDDEETKKWHKTFKKLEDLLGEIDYYTSLLKEFSKNKSITNIQTDYFKKKKNKAVEKLNKKLTEKDFFKKFMVGSSKPGVLSFNNKNVLLKLHEEIEKEIVEFFNFFKRFENGFTNMESQVHELRRCLRWISIYAQSLGGIIVIKEKKVKYKWEKEFIRENAVNSSYNKIPIKKGLKHYITFDKKAFYALTFVIEELGKIKDKGMAIEALAKAIEKTMPYRSTSAIKLANRELKSDLTVKQLLAKAHKLLSDFFIVYKIHTRFL